MPLGRINITIDDTNWPKLKISGERISSTGDRTAFDDVISYDLAYVRFENTLHNQLRPIVDELIKRRKQLL